jgi:hypothetical protein
MNTKSIKTSELVGRALDFAVAKATGLYAPEPWISNPSTNWQQGGEIIERERISVWARSRNYAAESFNEGQEGLVMEGQTPLIAAMRCYVASKLGDSVEIPGELL